MTTTSMQSDKMLRALVVLRQELNEQSDQATISRLELFLTVANEEGLTLQQLEHKLGCTQGTIVKHVKKLTTNIERDPSDPAKYVTVGKDFLLKASSKQAKQIAVFLGPHGKEVMKRVNAILTSGKSEAA